MQDSSRKRTHEEFVDDSVQLSVDVASKENMGVQKSIEEPTLTTTLRHLRKSLLFSYTYQ